MRIFGYHFIGNTDGRADIVAWLRLSSGLFVGLVDASVKWGDDNSRLLPIFNILVLVVKFKVRPRTIG